MDPGCAVFRGGRSNLLASDRWRFAFFRVPFKECGRFLVQFATDNNLTVESNMFDIMQLLFHGSDAFEQIANVSTNRGSDMTSRYLLGLVFWICSSSVGDIFCGLAGLP